MRCADFERRLNQLLDERQRAEDDASLQMHAAQCGDCQQLLVGQARLFDMVRIEITALPDSFAQQVVGLPKRPQRTSARGRILAALVALACTILIVAGPIAYRVQGSRFSFSKRDQRSRQAAPTTIASVQAGTRASARSQASEASAATTAESEELRRMIQDIWQKIPEVPESQLEPIDRLAGGFKPLASTLGAAFDAIRRSLPVGRGAEPTEPQATYFEWNLNERLS